MKYYILLILLVLTQLSYAADAVFTPGKTYYGSNFTGVDVPIRSGQEPQPIIFKLSTLPDGMKSCILNGTAVGNSASHRADVSLSGYTCESTDGTYKEGMLTGTVTEIDGFAGLKGTYIDNTEATFIALKKNIDNYTQTSSVTEQEYRLMISTIRNILNHISPVISVSPGHNVIIMVANSTVAD